MTVALALFAIIMAALGLNYLSQATLGVGLLATALLLGVLARLAQARAHHEAVLAELRKPPAS